MKELLDSFLARTQEEKLHVLYAQIRQKGETVANWSRFSVLTRLESFSTSKSFTAVGVGIAIDEGLLTLDEKVADSFPEYTYDVSNLFALGITVEDMLKMSSGLSDPLFFRDSPLRATVRDWGRYFYEVGDFVKKPGETFLYCNFNTYMLGRLIEKKTGQNLHEYLRFRLFEPLRIGNPDWNICPYGHTIAANGMEINVDEMGRFCEMMLNKGVFEGKRIVSEEFVQKATSPLIKSDKSIPLENAGFLDYGYQFWADPARDCFHLWGIFGQYAVVLPEKNTIVVILSLEENDDAVGRRVWEDIITQI